MREAWQVGQRRLTDLSKGLGTVEVEARVLRLRGKAQTHGGRLATAAASQTASSAAGATVRGHAGTCVSVSAVPAGRIDSELSSLSGGMAGRQAGIGAQVRTAHSRQFQCMGAWSKAWLVRMFWSRCSSSSDVTTASSSGANGATGATWNAGAWSV